MFSSNINRGESEGGSFEKTMRRPVNRRKAELQWGDQFAGRLCQFMLERKTPASAAY